MADGYWSRPHQQGSLISSGGMIKRPRTADYDLPPSGHPSSHDMHGYYARDDYRGRYEAVKDTKTLGSEYDRYLQTTQVSSLGPGESATLSGVVMRRAGGGGMTGLPISDSGTMGRSRTAVSDYSPNGRDIGFGSQGVDRIGRSGHEMVSLPPDASHTLYVEGLPPDSTRREVAHIFRPFVGYKELRLVIKESKHRGGDPIILCFVDFTNESCAATALNALQGYRMDEHDPDSNYLRLQFSRFPGPRSGSASRGRR